MRGCVVGTFSHTLPPHHSLCTRDPCSEGTLRPVHLAAEKRARALNGLRSVHCAVGRGQGPRQCASGEGEHPHPTVGALGRRWELETHPQAAVVRLLRSRTLSQSEVRRPRGNHTKGPACSCDGRLLERAASASCGPGLCTSLTFKVLFRLAARGSWAWWPWPLRVLLGQPWPVGDKEVALEPWRRCAADPSRTS